MSSLPSFRIIVILVLLWMPARAAAAQAAGPVPNAPDQGVAPLDLNESYFWGYATDGATLLTAPARWNAGDWLTASVVTGATMLLYGHDQKIQTWVQGHKTTTVERIGDDVMPIGCGLATVPIVGGMFLYGRLAHDAKMQTTSLLTVESAVLTGVIVEALKYATGRHRPFTGDPPHTWDGPGIPADSAQSFPSGHAAIAFSVASVIATEYDNAFVAPLAYAIAAITAATRVVHNVHWTSDVFAGSAIGFWTGRMVVAAHRVPKGAGIAIVPLINRDVRGLTLTAAF